MGVNVLVLKFARLYVISVSRDVITINALPQHIGRVPGAKVQLCVGLHHLYLGAVPLLIHRLPGSRVCPMRLVCDYTEASIMHLSQRGKASQTPPTWCARRQSWSWAASQLSCSRDSGAGSAREGTLECGDPVPALPPRYPSRSSKAKVNIIK